MKNKQNFVKINIFLILLISSCSNSRENSTGDEALLNEIQIRKSSDYFPLSKGGKGEYKIIYSTTFKTIEGTIVIKGDGMENINGKDYYKTLVIYSGIPGAETQTYYERKTDEGLYAINGKYKSSPEYLTVKLPLKIGDNWKSITPEGEFEYAVLGIETLELIDKKYKDCIKISMESSRAFGGYSGYSYYARDIGLVKEFFNDKNKGIIIESTLVSYSK